MNRVWWKEAVVYQVYWRSFKDTNGDGIGDVNGVIEKLDYIQDLGVDVIWLNPLYESPDLDNGYDISNYKAVMPKAGTLDELETLFQLVHERGMKVIMDLVVNHTSNQHPWFLASRSSRGNEKRDWYIWRDPDPETGGPPNNWRSYFEPSCWTFDEATGHYYYHSFAKEQPDLNWENPNVREAIYEMMRFWLDKGIDGFRMDVINLLSKREDFSDVESPEKLDYLGNNPGIHTYLKEMHDKVLKLYDIFTVGEIPFVGPEDGVKYVGEARGELHTLFHFQVADCLPTWDLERFREIQNEWYQGLWGRGWNSQFLNNHDHTRQVTRYGNDGRYRVESAKLLGMMIHTLPGTPYIYQGEEIGMTGVKYDSIEAYKDIAMKNKYKELVAQGNEPHKVLQDLQLLSRDNSRTPMQWNSNAQAGFTTGTPWIEVNPNYTDINVEQALKDPNSVFYFYKKLIQMRKAHSVMVYGEFKDLSAGHPQAYVYKRYDEATSWIVVLNPSDEPATYTLPQDEREKQGTGLLLLGNYKALDEKWHGSEVLELRPHEARIYEMQKH